MQNLTKNGAKVDYEIMADPVTGDLTIKVKGGAGRGGVETSYQISLDKTEATSEKASIDLKRFKIGLSHTESNNPETQAKAESYQLGASAGVTGAVGQLEGGLNVSVNLIKYQEGEKPMALDPRIHLIENSLSSGVGIGFYGKNGSAGMESGGNLVTIGASNPMLVNNEDTINPIWEDTTGRIKVGPWSSKNLFEFGSDELYERQKVIETGLEPKLAQLKRGDPHSALADWTRNDIATDHHNMRNLKLAEVYVVAEEAEKDLKGDHPSWTKQSFESGERVLYEKTNGAKLYVDRPIERTLYQRADGTVETLSYTDPHHQLNKQFDFGDKKTSLNVGKNGWAVLDGGDQQLFINRNMLLDVPEDLSQTKLYTLDGQKTVDMTLPDVMKNGVLAMERKGRWLNQSIDPVNTSNETGIVASTQETSASSHLDDGNDKFKQFIDEINKQKETFNENEQTMCLKDNGGIDFD